MGSHPANLVLRFFLEVTALLSVGFWGWNQTQGWTSLYLAIGLPVLMATIWGVFAVPNDPSRSGKAPVPVPGIIRLIFELGIFAFAVYCVLELGWILTAIAFGTIIFVHYLISYRRVIWLISN